MPKRGHRFDDSLGLGSPARRDDVEVMTLFAFFDFLFVLFTAGLPLSLLVRRNTDGRRVLLMPVLGLCALVLFTCFLASWGITGRNIARAALVVIVVAGAGAVLLSRLRLRFTARCELEPLSLYELNAAGPALCIGILAAILVAWPLFMAGCTNYWGLANPDQAFYMTIVDHLDNHSFGQPPPERLHSAGNAGPAAILGLCYLFPMVSTLTGIPSLFLFGVLGAAMLFLLPTSAYVLCRTGLGLSLGRAALAAGLVGVSSVSAQTFYHHSLGALVVAVVCPTALTLAALYVRKAEFRTALLLAFLLASMLFCYFPGFAVVGIIIGGWFLVPLLTRKLRLRSLLMVGGFTILLVLVYPRQCRALCQALIKETVSTRLVSVQDEIILGMDSILTDEFVPSVWGLSTRGVAPLAILVSNRHIEMILIGFGGLLLATTLFGFWKKRGVPAEFKAMLAVVAAVTAVYFARQNGYGVYKLTTWVAPLLIIALGLSCMTLYTRSAGFFRVLILLTLFSYAGLNVLQTVRLARFTRGGGYRGPHNAPDVILRDFRELETGSVLARPHDLFVSLPDPVLQRWAIPFLPDPKVYFLPTLTLNAVDSDPALASEWCRDAVARMRDAYLLYMTSALKDIVPSPDSHSAVWHSRAFAISPVDQVQNQLLVGTGWYRRETFTGFSQQPQEFRWLRKRAEMLILNPARTPQRLRLKVMAGYGSPSPLRHLVLFADGRKFDEIAISGQARILSKPFTTSARTGQLEILVREDVQPLPRTYGLWNRWIPVDPRRLNLAVFEVSLEPPATQSDVLQATVDLTSETQMAHTLYNGIYPDRWLAGPATIRMRIPGRAKTLRILGMALSGTNTVFPMQIRLNADDEPLGEFILREAGNFDASVRVPASLSAGGGREADVSIQAGPRCAVGTRDTRCLTVRLQSLSFEDSANSTVRASSN